MPLSTRSGRQIANGLLVIIDLLPIRARGPTREHATVFLERIGREGLSETIGELLILHRARAAVGIKLHGVGAHIRVGGDGHPAAGPALRQIRRGVPRPAVGTR